MTPFEFLSVALSFVLGLAVTVLLSSLLTAFRARRMTRMSWLPFAWAAYLLVMQFDLWWETYGLVNIEVWSAGAFVLLLVLALLLFAAGGLILPTGIGNYPEDLDEYFEDSGRWAVAVVTGFLVLAIVANAALFDVGIVKPMNLWNVLGIGITASVVGAKRRVIRGAATVAFGAWLGAYLWMFVPGTY